MRHWLLYLLSFPLLAQGPAIVIDSPMPPPEWALLQRTLLKANSAAAAAFANKYVDSRGYLLHTPRWGTLDGPDDAIETFYNWTLLHALGGDDRVLNLFQKAYEGHLLQYGELRTELTPLASNGAYHKEFITQSDWFHTGEGMRGFMMQGLSTPRDPLYTQRMRRFAGLYMNEDPDAPNYDPEHKVIRSLWTGSLGPMLRKATTYDWVGDPVPGKFHLLHSPGGRERMYDLEKWYPKMLAHCDEYLDSVGDHPLNLGATTLAVQAYLLTGEEKYRNWVLEYVNAWKERTASNGGNIPTNIGLDGAVGGEYDGKWYKGTYGWNFTIYDGEIDQIAHRNTFDAGSWPGFGNAFLLTGDPAYVDVLRRQMDNIYAQKKVEDGQTLLPQMFGDPRGYKYEGREEWYHFTANPYLGRLTEIYLWSMESRDLERLPKEGWIGFLEGKNPAYPAEALRRDLSTIRRKIQAMQNDPTTPDTRLADWPLGIVPVTTDSLTQLTTGGYFAGKIWTLHARLRYFDPEQRRAGLPPDVAALIDSMRDDQTAVTLVNLSATEPRTVVVQAGGYGEHQLLSAEIGGVRQEMQAPFVRVRLEPGSGARVHFTMDRYANQPTLAFPWDR